MLKFKTLSKIFVIVAILLLCNIAHAGFDSYTKLVSHFNGSNGQTTYTAETGQSFTFVGTAQLSTAQKKFGTSSLLLDGDSDYVTLIDSADWSFGTGDFTVDFWVNFNNTTGFQGFVGQGTSATDQWIMRKNDDGKLMMYFVVGSVTKGYYYTTSAPTINTGNWYHIAFVRSSGSGKIFLDGNSLTLTESTAFGSNDVGDLSATLMVGLTASSLDKLNGYIDEVRVSKGIARWTSNFTPPTSEYSSGYSHKVNGITPTKVSSFTPAKVNGI